jgi:diguanylate cyclase
MAGIQIRPLITYEPGCLRLGRHRRVFRRSAALLPPAQRAILADAPRAARRRVCEGLRHGGMHHTGMAASRFSAQSFCISAGTTDQHWLTLVIAGPAIAVLSITTILLVYDAHLESRTRKHNEQLEKANAQLEHPATHDSLTGLPNRVLLAVMHGPEELDPGAEAVERAGRANLGGRFRHWLLQPELFAAFAAG